MDNELLVQSIRNLCKINNISISQMESELNFGAGLVSRWVKSSPSIDKIVDIADYFHVSLDEVVGYHNVINDKFLEKLIQQTENRTIEWNRYDLEDEKTHPNQPKQYFKLVMKTPFKILDKNIPIIQVSFFAKINNAYLSLYGEYEGYNILKPSDLKLFIQPNIKSQLVEQQYTYEQLKTLWLKVLYALEENIPDEIKAEEFKNNFINE